MIESSKIHDNLHKYSNLHKEQFTFVSSYQIMNHSRVKILNRVLVILKFKCYSKFGHFLFKYIGNHLNVVGK
jgi:hypothetical protein